MEILFCGDIIYKHRVEEAYYKELEAVDALGITYNIFNHDAIIEGVFDKGTRYIPKGSTRNCIYRGWMLSPPDYERLYNYILTEKGLRLINNPEQYKNTHYLPASYELIKDHTPFTISIELEKFNDDLSFLEPFGDKPIIVKDFVKSEKHFWNTACYCPRASDLIKVKDTIQTLTRLRDIEGGYVFREYIELEKIGFDEVFNLNTPVEYRLFFLNGKVIDVAKYWECGEYDEMPPVNKFEEIGQRINSNFFTMDVAKKKDGEWIIIELGDGQVSGLTANCNTLEFFKKIMR